MNLPSSERSKLPMRFFGISILGFLLVAGCAASLKPSDPNVLIGRLVADLERLETRGFAGQLVVVRGDEVMVQRGFGTISPSGSRAVDAKSVMPLASATKPITASAVLALAADGRLTLDDPIGDHLPRLAEHWASIPIECFLVHTAGVPGEIVNRTWAGVARFEPVDREELLRRVNRFRPDQTPCTEFGYSNVGYNLLAALIEEVGGVSFEHFVARRLLRPAGIDQIGLLEPAWAKRDLVESRRGAVQGGDYFDQPMLADGAGFNLRGSGDLMATPDGIIAWWHAVRAGQWLPRAWLTTWLEPRVAEPGGGRYGYGLDFRDTALGTSIGHTGQVLHFTIDLSWYPERDLLVYINSADARFPASVLRIR